MNFILALSLLCFWAIGSAYEKSPVLSHTPPQEDVKTLAFGVLSRQCNVCHATKKKQDIFTLENMDSLATDINKQVFIKKKMPKGRKNNLSEQESNALKIWLNLVLNE